MHNTSICLSNDIGFCNERSACISDEGEKHVHHLDYKLQRQRNTKDAPDHRTRQGDERCNCHDRDNLLTHCPIVWLRPRDHCPPYCTFSPFSFVLVCPRVLTDQSSHFPVGRELGLNISRASCPSAHSISILPWYISHTYSGVLVSSNIE